MGERKLRVLVVDANLDVAARLQHGLGRSGFETREAESCDEARRIVAHWDPDTLVIDLEGVGRESLALIRFARQREHPPEVVVMTRASTVALAIEAMKLGAYDDLLVPVSLDALTRCVRAAGLSRRRRLTQTKNERYAKMKKYKVLLVDDEQEFINSLSERLQLRDVQSDIALDGETALELVTNETPDVMVLDLRMPGIDGIEVLRRVKEKYPSVQVIILTGHGSEKDEETARKLGAFDYLQKPVNLDTLVTSLKKAVKNKIEKTMVSAAFAEGGDFDTARQVLKEKDGK